MEYSGVKGPSFANPLEGRVMVGSIYRRRVIPGELGLAYKKIYAWSNRHALYILTIAFSVCALIYYFGELVDAIGFTNLNLPIFNTVHDLHRMLFLIPITYGAYHFRVKGALFVTLAALITFLPRAIFISPYPDPLFRMLLFVLFAGFFGLVLAIVCDKREQQSKLKIVATSERDRFLNILDGVGDGVCIIEPDYRLRFVNPAMIREFGEGIGSYCYKYLYGFDEPCKQYCRLPSVLRGENKTWEYTFPDSRTFEIIASPFRDIDGRICQLTTVKNITQYKRIELELLGLSKFKSEVLSNLSHELRSPLTSMKGVVGSLLQKDVEFDVDTHDMLLEGVLEETNRLERLVTNLLDMSKLEAGVWKPTMKRCSIFEFVNETVSRFSRSHREHIFEIEMEPDLPDIYADHGQIRQVLINLLDNASTYSEEGTRIRVEAKQVNEYIEFSMTDQGQGIPMKDADKIFSKFYRGNQKRKHNGGVGLGLAICQAIVTSHGGRIWANSAPGQGSVFYFTLPIQPVVESGVLENHE
jgi:signal transduction histidine kinase